MMKKSGMIDVAKKKKTVRVAKAIAFVKINEAVVKKIKNNQMPKGNVLEMARAAGILAAKKTPELIPLCHTLELEYVAVDFVLKGDGVRITSEAKAIARTGVEMEAMTACSVAALTIYDMGKMFTKSIEITDMYLVEKRGGKSGVYKRQTR